MKRNSDITVRFQVLKMRTCFLSLTAIELSISAIYPKSHFCTKRHKRLDFQGFLAFLSRSHGRLIKKTVNSRLKNANLCLRFGWVHFILTNHFCGECLFFVWYNISVALCQVIWYSQLCLFLL